MERKDPCFFLNYYIKLHNKNQTFIFTYFFVEISKVLIYNTTRKKKARINLI